VNHRCPKESAPRPGMPTLKKARTRTRAVDTAVREERVVPPMPDLCYAAQATGFADRYSNANGLNHMSVASIINASRLPPPRLQHFGVGDFFEWPGVPDTYACIIALAKRGKAHVTAFHRRPLQPNAICSSHPDGGGCWRCRLPLQSQLMKLPEGEPSSSRCMLVPRVATTAVAGGGPRRIDQRCYQRATSTETTSGKDQVQADILEFVASAASLLVEHTDAHATEIDSCPDCSSIRPVAQHAQQTTIWTNTLATIYGDAVNVTIDYARPPERCPQSG